MISDKEKEMRKRIADMSPQELLKASETFEALFDLVHQHDDNSIANTNTQNNVLNATIAQLTAELAEWREDAERFIQLANFNNKKAGEYFELHERLVKKYEVTK
jgi:endonuclease III